MATLRGSLVDWWDLDEASGDATGAHAGTVLTEVTTGAPIGTGTIGGRAARHFDPADGQYFTCADSLALSLGSDSPFTLALRVQFDTFPGTADLVSKLSGDFGEWAVRQQWLGFDGVRCFVIDNYALATLDHTDSLVVDTPYTIIMWHDPDADELGVSINNGTPVTVSHTTGTNNSDGPVNVGYVAFDGLIGSFAYAHRVWTAEERTLYYNGGAGLAYADTTAATIALPQITRDGLNETAVFIVPTDIEAIELDALIDSADLLDETLTVLVSVLASDDEEVTWNHVLYEGTWGGGTTVDPDTDLIAAMPWEARAEIPPALRGMPLKMQITPSHEVSIGVEMTLLP